MQTTQTKNRGRRFYVMRRREATAINCSQALMNGTEPVPVDRRRTRFTLALNCFDSQFGAAI
jgi:hypothetical protein